ncbi:acyl-CoA thioesterase [Fulvivirga sp. M361]|uniref:acyl-CoA thioesterase n=1 Tax=Fulvivirga sp. M361 TaxID=2594266 RepID=UPI00117ACE43|nr:acyl-CoA thioesterase [Fulvivirga sp. M361]TRX57703.1 acyl-CoA thioesterase [Fulvivirga sp. M361]
MNEFRTSFEVRWSDVDPNMHLRHTVYLDYADQTRIRFFEQQGLSFNRLLELNVGPIIFGTQSNFLKEVLLSEEVTYDCRLLELSSDGRKWVIKHNVYKSDGQLAAELTYKGAWFDLKARKLTVPPEEVRNVMNLMTPVEQ